MIKKSLNIIILALMFLHVNQILAINAAQQLESMTNQLKQMERFMKSTNQKAKLDSEKAANLQSSITKLQNDIDTEANRMNSTIDSLSSQLMAFKNLQQLEEARNQWNPIGEELNKVISEMDIMDRLSNNNTLTTTDFLNRLSSLQKAAEGIVNNTKKMSTAIKNVTKDVLIEETERIQNEFLGNNPVDFKQNTIEFQYNPNNNTYDAKDFFKIVVNQPKSKDPTILTFQHGELSYKTGDHQYTCKNHVSVFFSFELKKLSINCDGKAWSTNAMLNIHSTFETLKFESSKQFNSISRDVIKSLKAVALVELKKASF